MEDAKRLQDLRAFRNCAAALGLAADATKAQVIAAVQALDLGNPAADAAANIIAGRSSARAAVIAAGSAGYDSECAAGKTVLCNRHGFIDQYLRQSELPLLSDGEKRQISAV